MTLSNHLRHDLLPLLVGVCTLFFDVAYQSYLPFLVGRGKIAEGLRFVFGNSTLRSITLCTATGNFAGGAFAALQVLFLTRELGLPAAGVGLVLAISGVGGILGAFTASWWSRRIGQARAVWLVPLLTWPAQLLVPLAVPGWRVGLAVSGLVIVSYGIIVYNVAQVSYRQAICPDRLLGRMNASVRSVVWARCQSAACSVACSASGSVSGVGSGWPRRG